MLSVPTTTSAARRRRGHLPSRGEAWRRRKPAAIGSSLDLKLEQLVADRIRQFQSPINEEALIEAPMPLERGIFTTFRLMTFADTEEDLESDYAPSEEEEDEEGSEEDASVEELFEEYQGEEGDATAESEEQEEELDDSRWWTSSADKRQWEKRYRQADAAFRKRFGCGIDTPAHPETRRRLRKEKSRHRAYTFVLAGLVIAYLVQLAVVYSASSWAFSMVAWRPSTTENNKLDRGDELADTREVSSSDGGEHRPASIKPTALSPQPQVPEHVRTGLHLCSTLARRVVKSEHDVTSIQHALRACDLAVKFAPLKSCEAIEAHVLRGDLRSLLSRFDGADEDYQAAQTLVLELESSGVESNLVPGLTQDIDLKVIANRWTQMYKAKSFKELRREAKALVVRPADQDGAATPASAVSDLAADWLSAFKRKKPILEVLTLQRTWTLRRLKYAALGDDDEIKPDAV
ncbi:hypothetical protein PRNP1_004690 [Phytophthora ramorum]